jgi:WD40 repeat protein
LKVNEGVGAIAMGIFPVGQKMVTAHLDGEIKFWDSSKPSWKRTKNIPAKLTSCAVSTTSCLYAIGSEEGYVRIYSSPLDPTEEDVLIFRQKVHKNAVKSVMSILNLVGVWIKRELPNFWSR